MSEKTQIVRELGQEELLLPKLIMSALYANDKTKYYFSLMQVARERVDNPDQEFSNLKIERQASGIDDSNLDAVVEMSNKKDSNYYHIPHAERIFEEIIKGIQEMMLPLDLVSHIPSLSKNIRYGFQDYKRRFDQLKMHASKIKDDDVISDGLVDQITSLQRGKADSFHLIVMDLHKELNNLQSLIYNQTIGGANVYGITKEDDKNSIRAFMKGINRTSKLKFDHEGLATTATKSAAERGEEEVLTIQNDIGATDAHVLIVHVKKFIVTVTYTDIHTERLLFFQSLFSKFNVKWSDAISRKSKTFEKDVYYLSVGTFEGKDRAELENYLAFLGSQIVFLIDWNRARKRLQNFLKKKDAIKLLKWAAENDCGHMAFLKLGGERLVYDAIEKTPKTHLRYGEQFYEVLGRERAIDFLKYVLKNTSEGLLDNRSELLIRDQIRAELAKYFRSIYHSLLEISADHASLIVEASVATRDEITQIGIFDSRHFFEVAERAKRWESMADDLLNKVRSMTKRSRASPIFGELLGLADDAIDSLEESLFLMTLSPLEAIYARDPGNIYNSLRDLSDFAVQSSREYLKAIEGAMIIQEKTASREDINDFLEAINRILVIEHQADDTSRIIKSSLINEVKDFKQLCIFTDLSDKIEESTDYLMKAGIVLRDYIFEDVIATG